MNMVHKGIATMSAALMVCFFVLSHLEPDFFLLHLYQSLIYLAIILMLFYFEDRYAYMLGILAPAVWLLLAYATGLLGGAARQVSRMMQLERPNNNVSLLAGVAAVLAVMMIILCLHWWRREYAGLGKGRSTFLASLGIVAVYYAVLVIWFWRLIPQASAVK